MGIRWQKGGFAGLVFCWGLTFPALAGELPSTPADQDAEAASAEAERTQELETRAGQLRAFLDGKLDVKTSPETLFEVPLDDSFAQLLRRRLDGNAIGATGSVVRPEEESAAERVRRLQVEFLNLPVKRREELLELHRQRQKEASFSQQLRENLQKKLEQLEKQALQLDAFLKNSLDPRVDPERLLQVNLLDSSELGLDETRAQAFLGDVDEGEASRQKRTKTAVVEGEPPASPEAEMEEKVRAAAERLDQVRKRYLALSENEREALAAAHRARATAAPEPLQQVAEAVSEAEAAARRAAEERKAALEVSRSASTEALRLLSEERARLLGVKEAQARFLAFVSEIRRERELIQERALAWVRKIQTLQERPLLERPSLDEYDATYDELVGALTEARSQLDDILGRLSQGDRDVPGVGTLANLPDHPEAESVRKLARELSGVERSLRQRVSAARWAQAQASRDAVVRMNNARLVLMAHLSPEKRSALKGFGTAGIRQAGRELKQISLEVRYHMLAVPRFFSSQFDGFSTSPIPIVFSVLKLAILVYFFRLWRKRSESTLKGVEKHFLDQRPQSLVTRTATVVAWYVRQIHRPVEWLVFFAILAALIESNGRVPELGYVSTVVLWSLVGGIVIRLLNAIAARQGDTPERTGILRLRSLRLVGITVVVNGMILGLAEKSVGDGTLYDWVLSTCWFLALPIGLVLVHWWRPIIVERAAAQRNPTPLIRWVVARKKGPASFLAAAVGGVSLAYDGIRRYLLQQAAHLAVTQRFLAYLFRREVEKQAEAKGQHLQHEPIPDSVRFALDPLEKSRFLIQSVNEKAVEVVRQRLVTDTGTAIAVVGERGIGKTTFVERVTNGFAEGDVVSIQCPLGGFEEAVAELGRALGVPGAAEDVVFERLVNSPPKVIVIDDAGRLIRPLIGGLNDIDRLVEFARASGSSSWVLTMCTPSWQYLKRARGERAVFDEVARLRPFTEAEISELIAARAKQANISPKYDELVVPRQIEGPEYGAGKDHAERDYSRILWDYADGNPTVALHFFRESLGVRQGQIYVRLFRTPALAELEDLPSTVYFVLRSIVQLEQASEADIVSCTALHPADVSAALRASSSKKLTERVGERVRINLPWFRAITSVLERHHLLMRSV